jgi:glucose-6-phosphate isomerase, archaeal
VSRYATPPIDPFRITFDAAAGTMAPEGPVLTRRLSDLEGLFRDAESWRADRDADDRVVYTVAATPVPEAPREVPQSITTINPGTCAGEFYMTKGHQHPDPQGEIYLGLTGVGGLLLFDGERTEWIDMGPGVIGYIPPGWAHRSVNVGDEPYRFLAVYPGSAGHDYQWVLDHGMGRRAMRIATGYELVPFTGMPR